MSDLVCTSSPEPEGWRGPRLEGVSDAELQSYAARYRELLEILEASLVTIARRLERSDSGELLPGIGDVPERIVLYVAPARASQLGSYCPGVWRYRTNEDRQPEIVLNAGHLGRDAEQVATTLIHELVHAHADACRIPDTSRGGEYHNQRFEVLATRAGLEVSKDARFGHVTTGISECGFELYGDVVECLGRGLGLHSPLLLGDTAVHGVGSYPHLHAGAAAGGNSGLPVVRGRPKYVMARCHCRNHRGKPISVRIARGNWQIVKGSMWCNRCSSPFVAAR